jgi:fatty-acyl-CoA synthase
VEHRDDDLGPNSANYVPLSPLTFLKRSARVFARKTAVIHGDWRLTYAQLYERVVRLASALANAGLRPGDTAAIMAPNVPALLEAHFGVPMAGGVLNAVNVRLDAATVRLILQHGRARFIIVDRDYAEVVREALSDLEQKPAVIDIVDPLAANGHRDTAPLGEMEYEAFLAGGDSTYAWTLPSDEWQSLALNYTSGTTGKPKGVVYHHRGAYLNALGNALAFRLTPDSVYLWTLPMFHCNGWCYPQKPFGWTVEVATGGAAPPSTVIERMEQMGFHVTHLYGLTETYGPATLCEWQHEWDDLPLSDRARHMARQGVPMPTQNEVLVLRPGTNEPVSADGRTLGEIAVRGNTVMKGYLDNPDATREAFAGGWFRTGDLAVMHEDHYIEIKDRAKDIIISGGENISTLEIEEALYRHPAVMEAAVVAKPDDKWGETPCAFVTLKPGEAPAIEEDLITWCRDHLAHFKCPHYVVFVDLPKTSTGKVQKYVLRDWAKRVERDT